MFRPPGVFSKEPHELPSEVFGWLTPDPPPVREAEEPPTYAVEHGLWETRREVGADFPLSRLWAPDVKKLSLLEALHHQNQQQHQNQHQNQDQNQHQLAPLPPGHFLAPFYRKAAAEDGGLDNWGVHPGHISDDKAVLAGLAPKRCVLELAPFCKGAAQERPAQWEVSQGSIGHPYSCGEPCKYARKRRGCKDGAACDHCHLCEWKQRVNRGSNGHPFHCGEPCKFVKQRKGCKDGAFCDHCHLCKWKHHRDVRPSRPQAAQGEAELEWNLGAFSC